MDFFGKQEQARKQSLVLLLVFTLVLVFFALVIHGFSTIATHFLVGTDTPWTSNRYSLLLTLTLWLFIALGCWFRYLDVRGGGRRLAERFGATAVLATSRAQSDRALLDVVAEMSIAASVPAPATFCLRRESAINAFVVGGQHELVLVVSQGALDMLDREELQGVVGHEFGHLVNGDLDHNMLLLIALGGLNSIDEIGKRLLGGAGFFNSVKRSSHVGQASLLSIPLLSIGLVLRAIGSLGVLGGSVIKAAFSRQRELLADASSVQFTRNSYALASALDRVNQYAGSVALHSEYVHELEHLCFQVPVRLNAFKRVLATHPPLRDRIKAIDPHFSVKARKRRRIADATENAGVIVGQTSGLSDRFELFASDQVSCLAILFALFVSKNPERADHFFSAIGFAYNRKFKEKVRNVHAVLGNELDINKLRIIDYIAPSLNEVTASNRQQLLLNLEKLVDFEQENSLANFAALQLLRRKLESEIPTLQVAADSEADQGSEPTRRSITELGKELSLLLSLMVEASGHNREKVLHDYKRVLKCYTVNEYPMRSLQEDGVTEELERAFHALYTQPLSQRQAFVRHCDEIMQFDGIKMEQEKTLINLFAASLGVPEIAAA